MKRYETVSRTGISLFSDEKPGVLGFSVSDYVIDHLEKVVLKCREMPGPNIDVYHYVLEQHTHLSKPIRDRMATGKPIGWDEYKTMRINSYERQHIIPMLTLDALYQTLKTTYLPNCAPLSRTIPGTYDEAVIHLIVPALMEKLEHQFECDKAKVPITRRTW